MRGRDVGWLVVMMLKREVLALMKANELRMAAWELDISMGDCRRRESLVGGMQKSRPVTAEALLAPLRRAD